MEAVNRYLSEAVNNGFSPECLVNGLGKNIADEVQPLLSLILYLCSEIPEYSGGAPTKPQPKKTKMGLRLFAPDKPKMIEVGKSIGSALRSLTENENLYINNRSVRPHIRRGHWHRYRIGKRSSKEFVLRWVAPMGINTEYLLSPYCCDQEAA